MRGLHIVPVVLLLTTSMQRVPGFAIEAPTGRHSHLVVLRANAVQRPLSTETILCHRKHAPGRGVDVGRIRIVMPGDPNHYFGHQVALFRPHAGDLQSLPKHCLPIHSGAWDMLAQTTRPVLDWQLPPGVAFHLEPHEPLLVQTDYLRRGASKRRGQEITKTVLYPMDRAAVTAHAGTLTAEDRTVGVLPRGDTKVASRCMMTGEGATARDLNIIGLRGHYLFRGVAFSVYRVKADGTLGELLYQYQGYDQPDLQQYTEPLVLHAGEGLEWRCRYIGPGPFPQERCDLMGAYYPTATPQETITCVHDRDASGRDINLRTVTP